MSDTAEHPEDLMGLSDEEYDTILNILGRTPKLTELGIFSVMWSEHCSYKSSKFWLKTLPTEGPQVIQGPGENAGVIDIGDGLAAIFKIDFTAGVSVNQELVDCTKVVINIFI